MNRIVALLFIFSFAWTLSAAQKTFEYPSTVSQTLGKDTVKVDLMQEYEKELALAKREFALISDKKKLNAAISEKFEIENKKVFDITSKISFKNESKNISSVTREQAQTILDKIPKHPIVSDKGSLKYDTPMRQIGYCFGKAAYAHIELLRHGVDAHAIAKIFVLGPLIHSGRGWDFHVTTIVQAREGGWWVIDGLEKKVVTLDDWRAKVLKLSQSPESPRIRFYFSDATKLNPTPGGYGPETLDLSYYKGFFRDLGKWFVKNPVKPEEVFTQPQNQ